MKEFFEQSKSTLHALLFASVLLLFPPSGGESSPYKSLIGYICDGGHFLLFAAIAVYLAQTSPYKLFGPVKKYLLIALLLLFFSGGIELIQPFFGRWTSLTDYINGAFGIFAGLLGNETFQRRASRSSLLWSAATLLSFGFCLSLVFAPALRTWKTIQWQKDNFPLLSDFTTSEQFPLWTSSGVKLVFTDESLVWKQKDQNPRAIFYNARLLDWSSFDSLLLHVVNHGEPFLLHIRIDDNQDCTEYENRFNRQISLGSGANHISIPTEDIKKGPLKRPLNLKAIRRIILFTPKQYAREKKPIDFEIRRVELTQNAATASKERQLQIFP